MEVHQLIPSDSITSQQEEMDTLFLGILYVIPCRVRCGFFVENQREHYVEHKREKQYMRSNDERSINTES